MARYSNKRLGFEDKIWKIKNSEKYYFLLVLIFLLVMFLIYVLLQAQEILINFSTKEKAMKTKNRV